MILEPIQRESMKIKTQPIKDFFAYTRSMKPNNAIPAYEYMMLTIKDGVGVLEKTNGQVYCKHSFEHDGELQVMIEDIEMKTFLSACSTSDFDLLIDGNNVTLQSGKLNIGFQTIPTDSFPAMSENPTDGDIVDVSKLFIASKFTDPKQINWMTHVVATPDGIIGTDNSRIYYHNTPMKKEMVLSVECCNIILPMQNVRHSSTETHDFFHNEDVTYAFTKSSYHNVKFMQVVSKIHDGTFQVKKADLLLFCDTAAPRSDKHCTITGMGKEIELKMNDNAKAKTNSLVVEIEGECNDTFNFHSANLANAIRHLPYETLSLNINGHLSITSPEDENYKGILTQIIL